MKTIYRRLGVTTALALVSGLGGVSAAEAQEAAPLAGEARDGDIIVMAQKRAESVRDVPLAISAFSGETLEDANVTQLFDVQRLAPSLRIDLGARADKPRIVIRGIGSSGGTAIEPSVATFMDGVYIPREGATLATYLDIDAVEILRGPQGTLFGRNASVGAISLRSAAPRFENSGKLTAEYGTGNRFKLGGYLNVADGDKFAVRVAAQGENFEGLYRNALTGGRVGGVNSFAGRVSLRARFSEQVEDTLRVGYSQRRGNDYFTPYLLMPDTFPSAAGRATYLARFAGIGSNNVDLTPFDRTINQYVDDLLDEKQLQISNELAFTTDGDFQIKLISGVNRWEVNQRGHHVFGAETPTGIQYQHSRSTSHQEELQFITPDDFLMPGLSAVAGLYYFEEDLVIDEDFQIARDGCNLLFAGNPALGTCLAGSNSRATDVNYDQTTDSIAAYAQLTYKLAPTLDLTLGTRWSQDKKDALFDARPVQAIGAIFTGTETTPLALKQSRVTWRANLAWKPTDDAMLFASYTTGFKSGGFNSAASNVVLGQTREVRPETVKSYEIGAKTSWLDNALQLDVVLYQMDIKDFQDRAFTGVTFAVRNAGGVRNRGVETDISIRPADWFRLSGGVAYLDSEFTSYPGASALPGLPGTQDLKGTRPTFTPKWSGTLGAEFNGDLGSGMRWLLRGDMNFTSKANIGGVNDNNPDTVQDGYALFSARATLSGPDDRWSISLFGANLTDKGYCTSYAYQPFGALIGAQAGGHAALRCNVVGTPRTFGVAASFGF
ncbi:TonB-dependent receptor [Sphingopyxis flava]|uniref:Iron complex outermembrane recepter protein n=1 Tax=Sphingopyxis flava TaxID=1507287 RepID=A0A1T5FGX4_9SPHN|nr:TonB-dependent receptor [Sphingopyxis flava]SKB95357.1 iron complex outermembrane recepter protein [Sphingopyxis flava]